MKNLYFRTLVTVVPMLLRYYTATEYVLSTISVRLLWLKYVHEGWHRADQSALEKCRPPDGETDEWYSLSYSPATLMVQYAYSMLEY